MNPRETILITAEALSATLEAERELAAGMPRTRVLDVRWTLPEPDGRPAFERGHIPSAVYVDLDTELSQHGTPKDGRHPLPSIEKLQDAARRWGINAGDAIVVTDGGGNLASARAWWLLRWAGLENVRLLDGALPAWERAGFALETGPEAPIRGNVTVSGGHLPTLDLSEVTAFIADGGALLDARAPERYRGESEPIDPRAGHIPGALNAPTGDNLDAQGRFLSADALAARFAAAGVTAEHRVASSCGSGVTAAHTIVALALAGIDGALYPGSWSQWSNHPELPVATGDRPG